MSQPDLNHFITKYAGGYPAPLSVVELFIPGRNDDERFHQRVNLYKLAKQEDSKTRALILPHVEAIEIQEIGLPEFGELAEIFPGFHSPKNTNNLRGLDILVNHKLEQQWFITPPSGNPPYTCVSRLGPFFQITTLTEFSFTDLDFAYPLETLLNFLKGNPSLESIMLYLKFKDPAHRLSQNSTRIELEQLRTLKLRVDHPEDALGLIPRLCTLHFRPYLRRWPTEHVLSY